MTETIEVDCWFCYGWGKCKDGDRCPFCGGTGKERISVKQAQTKLLVELINSKRRR